RVFETASPMRKVELRRLPEKMPPLGWRGHFEDPLPPDGDHAYWVRIRQSDGAYAWSTPIFTTLDAKPAPGPTQESALEIEFEDALQSALEVQR
ncbi:MAG: hypothetical protein ABJB04_09020, partial [Betaproteobacteria bacterium]